MKKYCVCVKFVTLYTGEEENRVDFTDSREGALGAFALYLENPEVAFATVTDTRAGKLIAFYRP